MAETYRRDGRFCTLRQSTSSRELIVTPKQLGFVLLVTTLGSGSGCTSQQLYATGQAYQRNQCLQLPDPADRDRCLDKAGTTYDEYKRETGR
jgi:hypothetical protein